MGIVSTLRKQAISGFEALHLLAVKYGEYRNIRIKENLCSKVTLTGEQEAEIKEYFREHYGKEIATSWHRLYQSYTGSYRVNYFPEILFSTELEPKLNDATIAAFLGDKNLLYRLFGDVANVHIPKTYGSCVNGILQDAGSAVVGFTGLMDMLNDIGSCVIKKTVDTSSGRDVALCDFCNGVDRKSGNSIADVVASFGKNFVIQETICQSEALAMLNRTSVNTFRVMSYICDESIKICPIALRLGRSNADRDNIHYGGICIGIKPDGALRKQAFSEYGEAFDAHPDTGVVFHNYKIPGAESLAAAAKRLHARIPYLKIISWDLTLDQNGVVTLIEMNTVGQSAWFPQMVNGEPLFGEDTPAMLKIINRKKTN